MRNPRNDPLAAAKNSVRPERRRGAGAGRVSTSLDTNGERCSREVNVERLAPRTQLLGGGDHGRMIDREHADLEDPEARARPIEERHV